MFGWEALAEMTASVLYFCLGAPITIAATYRLLCHACWWCYSRCLRPPHAGRGTLLEHTHPHPPPSVFGWTTWDCGHGAGIDLQLSCCTVGGWHGSYPYPPPPDAPPHHRCVAPAVGHPNCLPAGGRREGRAVEDEQTLPPQPNV